MNTTAIEDAVDRGDWLEIFLSPYISGEVSAALFVLLVFGGSIVGVYQWTRSAAITGVWLILVSPLVIAFAPGILAQIVALIIILVTAISLYSIYQSQW